MHLLVSFISNLRDARSYNPKDNFWVVPVLHSVRGIISKERSSCGTSTCMWLSQQFSSLLMVSAYMKLGMNVTQLQAVTLLLDFVPSCPRWLKQYRFWLRPEHRLSWLRLIHMPGNAAYTWTWHVGYSLARNSNSSSSLKHWRPVSLERFHMTSATLLPVDTATYPRKFESPSTPLWETEIMQVIVRSHWSYLVEYRAKHTFRVI